MVNDIFQPIRETLNILVGQVEAIAFDLSIAEQKTLQQLIVTRGGDAAEAIYPSALQQGRQPN